MVEKQKIFVQDSFSYYHSRYGTYFVVNLLMNNKIGYKE